MAFASAPAETFGQRRSTFHMGASHGREFMPVSTTGYARPIRLPGADAPLATGVRTVFGFDVSTDGNRLLIVQNADGDRPRDPTLVVIQNWLATTASSPAADTDPGR